MGNISIFVWLAIGAAIVIVATVVAVVITKKKQNKKNNNVTESSAEQFESEDESKVAKILVKSIKNGDAIIEQPKYDSKAKGLTAVIRYEQYFGVFLQEMSKKEFDNFMKEVQQDGGNAVSVLKKKYLEQPGLAKKLVDIQW